jgi:hypothetical protein
MRILRILAVVVAVLLLGVAGVFLAARFHDGPLALVPGGPLTSGELVADPVADWSFAAPVDTIELQLVGDGTSRTTWILVRDGQAYIPCSLGFPPGKRWHLRADRDGRAILRILGKRYPVTLTRVQSPALETELGAIATAKYRRVPPTDAGVWFFAVASRT